GTGPESVEHPVELVAVAFDLSEPVGAFRQVPELHPLLPGDLGRHGDIDRLLDRQPVCSLDHAVDASFPGPRQRFSCPARGGHCGPFGEGARDAKGPPRDTLSNLTLGAASRGGRTKGEIGKRVARGTLRIAGALAKRAAVAASRRAGKALTRAGERGIDGVIERAHRLPIQQSIDVAVPPEIAWEQWMELRHLPEGTHRLTEVERDGDELNGMLDGLRARSWSAEVIDERDQESFAWRSTEGSDSAGL